MKTQHYIINPYTGELNTLSEWEEYVSKQPGADMKDAQCICIIPEDGTPFAFPKNDLGRLTWEDAVKAAASATIPLPDKFLEKYSTGIEISLPSRKQGIDIGDCNHGLADEPSVHLDDTLEAIGGEPFSGTSFWSSSRCGAYGAWCFHGGTGFAYTYSGLYSSFRALPLVLCPGAKRP